ncbi:MAG: metallophosphoesterase, partial [Clostridia bacterium]|nr:metallophosphoesterase [Clostridia bacterium]
MKIIHTADLHLDSKLNSNFSTDKAKIRRNEILLNFSRLLSDAEKQGVKIVIIAGDLFDEEKITKYAKEEV